MRTALDAEYVTSYTCLDVHHCYSVTDATRIREIADFGASPQHELPENHGTGLIWRLHRLTRLEERDGGVYVEIEVVALSRDIPAALRWMVEPIVRRVSTSSLVTSLQQTQAAVRAHSGATTQKRIPRAIRNLMRNDRMQRLQIGASHFRRLPMITAPPEADQLFCVAYSAQSDWIRDCTLCSESEDEEHDC